MGVPGSILLIQQFDAVVDVPVALQIAQVLLLMPIFRWDSAASEYIDATGEYDLCMDALGTKYHFTSRRTGTNRYAYRYVSVALIGSRR